MNKEAILRAADWLEANPDKHIAGHFALDQQGNRVNPKAPNACYFCAIGRVIHEIRGLPDTHNERKMVARAMGVKPEVLDTLVKINDTPSFAGLLRRDDVPLTPLPHAKTKGALSGRVRSTVVERGNATAIEALRQIAA